ncbi:MAG: DMT family transporter [Crocinitomicaceae bacterium]|nr:DMT family transporter [Crocinitomicaceae bacterium]
MNNVKAHLALFVVNLLYSINYLVAKGLMPSLIGANGFIVLRVLGATTLFWILLAFAYEKVAKRDLIRIAICGFFGVGVNQLFFFNGLMRTSPVNASVIMVTTPILVLVLSLIFLKERISRKQITGVLIGAIAAVILSLNASGKGTSTGLGDLFILLNAASYGIYLILVKPLMSKYNALTIITWVFTFGLVVVLLWPFSLSELKAVDWNLFNTTSYLKLIFVIVGVTFMPYLLMVYAMKTVSPYVASVYIYLQPVLAALFIYLYAAFGMENYMSDLGLLKVICACLIFLGVYLVIAPESE